MSQENKKLENNKSTSTAPKDNLVSLQESGTETQVMDINKQMSSLEGSIASLNKKLNTTNKQIKADVTRLTSSDAEITDRVADTYRQLGAIQNTFDDLSKQSNKITSDLQKINRTIDAFEKNSTNALNDAIDKQAAVNEEFKQYHADLISRAETLSKKATSISTKLTKSIKDNSKALTELEARIVTELETVAQTSEMRDEKLDNKITASQNEISSQKAKMLLMQKVDEALDKRAALLEETSARLMRDSEDLKDSTEILDILTTKLAADVDALEIHTAHLARQNTQQQGFIDSLQDKTHSLTRTLLALADLEKKHFKTLAATSLLLLLAVIASFFYAEYMRNTEQSVGLQRNEFINTQVAELQGKVEGEQLASKVFYSEISELQSNLNQVQTELQQKTDQIQQVVQKMTDQVDSLDGRVQYLAPLYNFGSENTIHGSQWLTQLDENKLSIKIATVADKQAMYDIAQRYNHYFTRDLAYFMSKDNQYTLIYGGNFNDEQQLAEILRRMPRYMNSQRIGSIANADILQQIQL